MGNGLLLCGFLILHATAGFAQQALPSAPYPDFEAKRIRPPEPGSGRRITIQIEPSEADVGADLVLPGVARAPKDAADSAPPTFSWFWDAVGGDLAGASPGRLLDALAVLETQPQVPAPRLQSLQDMIAAYGVLLLTSTVGTDVSPALALAVMAVESGGRPDAISDAGAQGLMQLTPSTAKRFGVEDAFDPQQNIAGGVRFLDWLMDEFSGDPILVLAAYNAGERALRQNKGVPSIAETRAYVPKVLAAFRIIRSLCQTPPLMISDGCVFRTMK